MLKTQKQPLNTAQIVYNMILKFKCNPLKTFKYDKSSTLTITKLSGDEFLIVSKKSRMKVVLEKDRNSVRITEYQGKKTNDFTQRAVLSYLYNLLSRIK